MGSGHSTMVLFEIVPSPRLTHSVIQGNSQLASVGIRFRIPSDSTKRISAFNLPCNYKSFDELDGPYRFAASVALFGSLIKGSPYTRGVAWNELTRLANASYDHQDPVQQQFIEIIEKARKIYQKRKRRLFR